MRVLEKLKMEYQEIYHRTNNYQLYEPIKIH
jgi:hypothetical protein